MATIRKWLDALDFDWSTGIVLHQPTPGETPGWAHTVEPTCVMPDEVLDQEFDDGFGGPQCPRFVAYDHAFVYFPSQYDGATGPERVPRDPGWWAENPDAETPYPGG